MPRNLGLTPCTTPTSGRYPFSSQTPQLRHVNHRDSDSEVPSEEEKSESEESSQESSVRDDSIEQSKSEQSSLDYSKKSESQSS